MGSKSVFASLLRGLGGNESYKFSYVSMSGLAIEVCDGCLIRISEKDISGTGVRFILCTDALRV